MGLLDHKRTWEFDVRASSEGCVNAFYRAFTGRTKGFIKADWKVRRTSAGAIATYNGRGTAGELLSPRRSHAERDGAIGSQVTFEVRLVGDGRSRCTMYLSTHGVAMGMFTADARFIRPHMQAVQRHLRDLDSSLTVVAG